MPATAHVRNIRGRDLAFCIGSRSAASDLCPRRLQSGGREAACHGGGRQKQD